MVRNTYTNRRNFIESFLNNPRAGMKYGRCRMFTRQSPDGEGYQLIAYGHEVLAEVDHGRVELFAGHYGEVSRTVSDYLRIFGSVLSNTEGFTVTSHETLAPNTGIGNRLSQAAQYIDSYIAPFTDDFSAVEQDARQEVVEACQEAFNRLTE
jgi:peptidoglycan/xylan/chitin deacetylase (PgdA/CDA1 family)